jgi:DNA-directed RNA polymerase subunit N
MCFNIRCFTCQKPLLDYERVYLRLKKNGHDSNSALNIMGYKRICCRRHYLSYSYVPDGIVLPAR